MTGWKGIARSTLDQAGVEDLLEQGVAVPYRNESGAVLFHKRFGIDGSAWYEPRGIELTLFGREQLDGIKRENFVAVVCEGESDTLAAREHIHRWWKLPVVCVGIPGAKTWKPEWTPFLTGFRRCVLIPDHDPAGAKLARQFASDMPDANVAWLPERGQDLRGFLQEGGDPVELLDRAEADYRLTCAFTLGSLNVAEVFLASGTSMGSEELRTRQRVIERHWRERVLREAAQDAEARHQQALREQEEVESVAEELYRWAVENTSPADRELSERIGREVFGGDHGW